MPMRVDQPGDQGAALAVLFEIRAFGALVLAVEQLLDLAILVDDQPGEADELAVLVERDAVDIVDERVGVRGGGEGEGEGEGGEEQTLQFGSLVTSELVSFRPPPAFCTSA